MTKLLFLKTCQKLVPQDLGRFIDLKSKFWNNNLKEKVEIRKKLREKNRRKGKQGGERKSSNSLKKMKTVNKPIKTKRSSKNNMKLTRN